MGFHRNRDQLLRRAGRLGRIGAVCGATALIAAGYSASVSGASSVAVPNACVVLTPALAASALGAPVHRTIDAKPNAGETHCQYQSAGGAVDLLAGEWTFVNLGGSGGPGNPAKVVHGIGNQAYVTNTDFVARKGTLGIELSVNKAGSFSGAAATKQLALQAAAEEKLAPKLARQAVGRRAHAASGSRGLSSWASPSGVARRRSRIGASRRSPR